MPIDKISLYTRCSNRCLNNFKYPPSLHDRNLQTKLQQPTNCLKVFNLFST